MSRLAMVLTAVIAGQLVWYPVYAKDDKCHIEYETTCVRKVSYSFHEKVVEERREFKIEYIGPGQKTDGIGSGDPKLEGYKRPESTNNLHSGQERNGVTVGVSSAFGIVFLLVLVILVIFLCRRISQFKSTTGKPSLPTQGGLYSTRIHPVFPVLLVWCHRHSHAFNTHAVARTLASSFSLQTKQLNLPFCWSCLNLIIKKLC
ncbi:uncharacterized protein LOC112573832 isoform X3 [Pomacea canaliculata]|uniref:uncharacterized protein LOC112573832 isoform X3 n=1 Tax=Pomacea canaliculata TaxID=400727 RepID=UPI000D732954|nr:uncharacterized protein LOC112573832 isoform X3 [Pomacea canaliculata]